MIAGQDWGGPQGVGAALQRVERLRALVLMNTWLFTGLISKFHSSPRPWTTWHAPLIGQFFMRRHKVLSQHGPTATTVRGITEDEARAYHHVFDEADRITWCSLGPARFLCEKAIAAGRTWKIERRLPELSSTPALLLWAPGDEVFPIEFGNRLKELLPHAKGRSRSIVRGTFCRTTVGRIWRAPSWSF